VRDGPDVRGRVGSERRRKGRGLTRGPGVSVKEERGRMSGPPGRWAEGGGGGPAEDSRPAG
jgi:hypothetical protein